MSTATLLGGSMRVVVMGSRVRVQDDESEEEFTVVEPDEADVDRGLVSSESPIGAAVVGRTLGAVVPVLAPGGRRLLRIVAIATPGSEG